MPPKKKCAPGQRRCLVNRKLVCVDADGVCDTELKTARARARGCNEWVRIFGWMIDVMTNGGSGYFHTAIAPSAARIAVLADKVRPIAMSKLAVANPDPAAVALATKEQAALMMHRLTAWAYALAYYMGKFDSAAERKKFRDETLPEAMRLAKLEAAGKSVDGARVANVKLTRRRVMQKCPAETRACHKMLCTDANLPCAKEVTAFLQKTRRELLPLAKALEFVVELFYGTPYVENTDMAHAVKLLMPRVKQTPADTRIARARVLLATPAMQRDLAAVKYVYANAADKAAAKEHLKQAIVALRAHDKQKRQKRAV